MSLPPNYHEQLKEQLLRSQAPTTQCLFLRTHLIKLVDSTLPYAPSSISIRLVPLTVLSLEATMLFAGQGKLEILLSYLPETGAVKNTLVTGYKHQHLVVCRGLHHTHALVALPKLLAKLLPTSDERR